MKTIFVNIFGFIVCLSFTMFLLNFASYKSYTVPGTVIGKNIEQYAHGKHHRNMSTRYVMCVKPNDNIKFKTYDVYVTYSTYCTHNIGDGISFKVCEADCLRDFKPYSELQQLFILLGIITFGVGACVFISMILTPIIFKDDF